jgi:hypothetical protein
MRNVRKLAHAILWSAVSALVLSSCGGLPTPEASIDPNSPSTRVVNSLYTIPPSNQMLKRYRNPSTGDHVTAGDGVFAAYLLGQRGYQAEGGQGLYFTSQLPGTIPLKIYYSPSRQDYKTVGLDAPTGTGDLPDYVYVGTIGFVFQDTSQASEMAALGYELLPLNNWESPANPRVDSMLSTSPGESTIGWVGGSVQGYALTPATKPLLFSKQTLVFPAQTWSSITLRWTKTTGPYTIYRAQLGKDFQQIRAGIKATEFTDTGLNDSRVYRYKVMDSVTNNNVVGISQSVTWSPGKTGASNVFPRSSTSTFKLLSVEDCSMTDPKAYVNCKLGTLGSWAEAAGTSSNKNTTVDAGVTTYLDSITGQTSTSLGGGVRNCSDDRQFDELYSCIVAKTSAHIIPRRESNEGWIDSKSDISKTLGGIFKGSDMLTSSAKNLTSVEFPGYARNAVSVYSASGGEAEIVEDPTPRTILGAITRLKAKLNGQPLNTRTSYKITEVHSSEQAALALGEEASGFGATIREELKVNLEAKQHWVAVVLKQEAYSIAVTSVNGLTAADWISQGVSKSYYDSLVRQGLIGNAKSDKNIPVVLTQIDYGRKLFIKMSSYDVGVDLLAAANTSLGSENCSSGGDQTISANSGSTSKNSCSAAASASLRADLNWDSSNLVVKTEGFDQNVGNLVDNVARFLNSKTGIGNFINSQPNSAMAEVAHHFKPITETNEATVLRSLNENQITYVQKSCKPVLRKFTGYVTLTDTETTFCSNNNFSNNNFPTSKTGFLIPKNTKISMQLLRPDVWGDLGNRYLRHWNSVAYSDMRWNNHKFDSNIDMNDGTWIIRDALDGSDCYSFESANYPGWFLRHAYGSFRIDNGRVNTNMLFKQDATFCAHTPLSDNGKVSWTPRNYPSNFVFGNFEKVIQDGYRDDPNYKKDASWTITYPLAP